jgi:hypothetical protein
LGAFLLSRKPSEEREERAGDAAYGDTAAGDEPGRFRIVAVAAAFVVSPSFCALARSLEGCARCLPHHCR